MKLQTTIPIEKQPNNQIDYQSNILLLGSCFVENIGDKFEYFKFQNLQNPFGILFHPKAIETLVLNAIQKKAYSDKDVFFQNEQWHCFDAHSRLSDGSKETLLQSLNDSIKSTNSQIFESTHIIITLGTAWVYRDIKSDTIVANCHKVPQKQFTKVLLTIDEISNSMQNIVESICKVNPKANIIFTVSPVRHVKDGFVENTQSKAHLIAAIHNVLSDRAQSNCFYFPSYEIMLDELRDYRFYAEDMLHPNAIAVQYIWEKFKYVWLASHTDKTMNDVDVIQKGIEHRAFNPNSEAHQKFLQQLEIKKQELQSEFPYMQF